MRQPATNVPYWSVPKIWQDEVVFVAGSGPSLLDVDSELLHGRNLIVVNTTYQKFPYAQFLLFADKRWWDWHRGHLVRWPGEIITTSSQPIVAPRPGMRRLKRVREKVVEFDDPTAVAGIDSGAMGVNVAVHTGARKIVLVGFDMGGRTIKDDPRVVELRQLTHPMLVMGSRKRAPPQDSNVLVHWHQEHPTPSRVSSYVQRFLPQYDKIKAQLTARNIDLVSLTPTAIKCVRRVDLDQALA